MGMWTRGCALRWTSISEPAQRCASVLAGTRNVVRLYGDERMLEVPAGFGQRLEKRLARNAAGSGRGWSSWSAWLVPVAALALIVGGVLLTNSLTFRTFHQVAACGAGE